MKDFLRFKFMVKDAVKKENKAVIHTIIENPETLRKDILKSAIDAAKIIKSYNDYFKIRDLKLKNINKLHSVLKEIKSLEKHLMETDLPQLSESEEHPKPKVNEKPIMPKSNTLQEKKVKVQQNSKTEVERLKDELDNIERQLKDL